MLISSAEEINKHPLNNSPSKQQFSFAKTHRFKSQSVSICKEDYYHIPPAVSHRATNFGIGDRPDFTQLKSESPAPWVYNLGSTLKNTGVSFGTARELCKPVMEAHRTSDPCVPGPGTYNYKQKALGEEGPK